jgi:hypothetical protein
VLGQAYDKYRYFGPDEPANMTVHPDCRRFFAASDVEEWSVAGEDFDELIRCLSAAEFIVEVGIVKDRALAKVWCQIYADQVSR